MNALDVPRSTLNRALNLLGVAVAGSALITLSPAPWMIPFVIGLAAWVTVSFIPRAARRLAGAILILLALAGSLATIGSSGIGVLFVGVAVLQLAGSISRPRWHGLVVALASSAIIVTSAFFAAFPPLGLLSIEFGVLVALLGGFNRRQQRIAEAQSRALLEERVTIREEQARAELLTERQAVSRDIHDVLAHSLGGLVIQLDAVGALLEAGRISDATARVDDARALAVSGLNEARRAVGALREDSKTSPDDADDLMSSLAALVRTHRSLGGIIAVAQTGRPHALAAGEASTLSRMLQEALTNARKHAPGTEVRLSVSWRKTEVRLEVTNALGGERSSVATTGGGRGLTGMAERFTALPNATFGAAERDGSFEVVAAVRSDG